MIGQTLIHHLHKALMNSWQGLKQAYRTEIAFKLEVWMMIIALPLAAYIARSFIEYLLLVSAVFLILIVELLNTAIETTINRISLEYHSLSGLAKDIASAAILLAVIYAIILWSALFVFNKILS